MNLLEIKKLTIGISSMALFDLVESNKVFDTEGKEAYCAYQIAREDERLNPGVAYPLVKKLLGLNKRLPQALVEVICYPEIVPTQVLECLILYANMV